MRTPRRLGSLSLLLALFVAILLWPQAAQAQRGWPYPPGGYYRYPVRDELTSAVRLDVTPRHAEVFVDGYRAGIVDDFDGVFQRLRLKPGGHQLVLFLAGYRTIQEDVYLNPRSDQRLRFTLEPLRAGETSEPPPARRPPGPETGAAGRRRPDEQAPRPAPEPPPVAYGSLSLRVLPADAETFIDGERWSPPAGSAVVAIRLAEGRHHIEVRKEGYARYVEDFMIRAGRTLTLNVSLARIGF